MQGFGHHHHQPNGRGNRLRITLATTRAPFCKNMQSVSVWSTPKHWFHQIGTSSDSLLVVHHMLPLTQGYQAIYGLDQLRTGGMSCLCSRMCGDSYWAIYVYGSPRTSLQTLINHNKQNHLVSNCINNSWEIHAGKKHTLKRLPGVRCIFILYAPFIPGCTLPLCRHT